MKAILSTNKNLHLESQIKGKLLLLVNCLLLTGTVLASPPGSLSFIQNQGQWPENVEYQAEIPGGHLYILDDQLYYKFVDYRQLHVEHGGAPSHLRSVAEHSAEPASEKINFHGLSVRFMEATGTSTFTGNKPVATEYNYYLGNEPEQWVGGAKAYRGLVKKDIYEGIDLQLYSSLDRLKYDLIVQPHGNPESIRLQYTGADKLELRHGNLYIETSLQQLIEQKPYAFQIVGDDTVEVYCEFVLDGQEVSFAMPNGFREDLPLVIDPLLIFSTFSGSKTDNWGFTAAFDNQGNAFSGGIVNTRSLSSQNDLDGFPATTGAFQRTFSGGEWDMGILKFDSLGKELLYATYIGGEGTDVPHSLVTNEKGELYILGTTSSVDYPSTQNDQFQGGPFLAPFNSIGFQGSDLVVSKISSNGRSMLSSRIIGGSSIDGISTAELVKNYGDAFRGDIYLDSLENVFIASTTQSVDFPFTIPVDSSDNTVRAVAMKLTSNLDITWAVPLGNTTSDEAAFSVKSFGAHVYFAGGLYSRESFDNDGFIYQLTADSGKIISNRVVGTGSYDHIFFIDLDIQGNVYALGQTLGAFPVTSSVYSNSGGGQFIAKYTNGLETKIWSTRFGSGENEIDISPTAFLINDCGNIFISGWGGATNSLFQPGTSTLGLPVTENAFQTSTDGSDFYLMVLKKNASELLYATYIGGNMNSGEHVDGGTSRFDKRGIVYHAVCGGCGGFSDFPTTEDVWSNTNQSPNCNNAVFKFDLASLGAKFTTFDQNWENPGISTGCLPFEVRLKNQSIGGLDFRWSFGDGNGSEQIDSLTYTFEEPGQYVVSLRVTDENTCEVVDFAFDTLFVFDGKFEVMDDLTICQDESATLRASGAENYQWEPSNSLNKGSGPEVVANPFISTRYIVNAVDQNGCQFEDSIWVNVIPSLPLDFTFEKENNCSSTSQVQFNTSLADTIDFTWHFGDGNSSKDHTPMHDYESSGLYSVELQTNLQGCLQSLSKEVNIELLRIPNLVTAGPTLKDGKNDSFIIEDDIGRTPQGQMSLIIFNRLGDKVFESKDYKNEWEGENLDTGYYYYLLELSSGEDCKGWVHLLK